MELWIRTQDKETIMKVNRLDYALSAGEHQIRADGFKIYLATYKTKERALEILDDISSKIKNQFIVTVSGLWKAEDVKLMKNQLEKDYAGDFIMETKPLEIKPLNQNLIYYELPKE